MFTSSSTLVIKDKKASLQNLKLLICSEKGEMLDDPSFGVSIRKYIFDQNGYILYDILVDEIYSQIKIFAPQLTVNRKDIELIQRKETIYAKIKGINKLDFTTDMLELAIFTDDER